MIFSLFFQICTMQKIFLLSQKNLKTFVTFKCHVVSSMGKILFKFETGYRFHPSRVNVFVNHFRQRSANLFQSELSLPARFHENEGRWIAKAADKRRSETATSSTFWGCGRYDPCRDWKDLRVISKFSLQRNRGSQYPCSSWQPDFKKKVWFCLLTVNTDDTKPRASWSWCTYDTLRRRQNWRSIPSYSLCCHCQCTLLFCILKMQSECPRIWKTSLPNLHFTCDSSH